MWRVIFRSVASEIQYGIMPVRQGEGGGGAVG